MGCPQWHPRWAEFTRGARFVETAGMLRIGSGQRFIALPQRLARRFARMIVSQCFWTYKHSGAMP